MIATVTLAERLAEPCLVALREAISTDARVLVIEGAPGRFCLGMDFTAVPDRAALTGFAGVVRALLGAPMPTLAVVDGPALGGGLGIAAACDYVIATETARFGLPEALYGLAPAIIRPALARRLSPQRLAMLVATCHSRSATDALGLGLVDELCGAAELAVVRARAIRQLQRASRETMIAIRRWDAEVLKRALAAGVDETSAALARDDVRAKLSTEEPAWL